MPILSSECGFIAGARNDEVVVDELFGFVEEGSTTAREDESKDWLKSILADYGMEINWRGMKWNNIGWMEPTKKGSLWKS